MLRRSGIGLAWQLEQKADGSAKELKAGKAVHA